MLTTEIRPLDVTDPAATRAVALQRRAYAVEAEPIGSDRISTLHETAADLADSGETFLGAFAGDELAGLASWRIDGDTLDIHRLAVDPAHFRRGIGVALVRAALAAAPEATRAIVQTGGANEPAKALYRAEGFRELGGREPVPGLRVTLFKR